MLRIVFFIGLFIRYSDFIVNEVDLAGDIVHLTSLAALLEVIWISLSLYIIP